MKKKAKIILLVFLVALLFQRCGKEEKEESASVYFSLETNQISQLISDFDLGIKFKAPQNWEKRSAETSRKVETRGVYGGKMGEFIYHPSYVFFDDSTLSVLAMGKITPPDSLVGNENLLNLYAQSLSSKQKGNSKYDVAQFAKDGIRFTIFTIERANIISKRLIFQNKFNDIIQFEYTARSNQFQTEEEKIKQSIGSISLL